MDVTRVVYVYIRSVFKMRMKHSFLIHSIMHTIVFLTQWRGGAKIFGMVKKNLVWQSYIIILSYTFFPSTMDVTSLFMYLIVNL